MGEPLGKASGTVRSAEARGLNPLFPDSGRQP
jgi:hypothetical protein